MSLTLEPWKALCTAAEAAASEGQVEQAESLLKRASQIVRETLGPSRPELACILNQLGDTYMLQKKYDQAEPLYWQTMRIYQDTLGANHLTTAIVWRNLADLYQEQNRLDEAQKANAHACSIFSQIRS